MTYTRLRNSHREDICAELTRGKFDVELETIEFDRVDLALEIYKKSLGDAYDEVLSLPREWFNCQPSMNMNLGMNCMRIRFNTKDTPKNKLVELPVLPVQRRFKLPGNSPLLKRWRELNKKEDGIRTQQRELKSQVYSTLNAHASVGSLLKAWPEITLVVNKVMRTRTAPYIAKKKLDLNVELGLTG